MYKIVPIIFVIFCVSCAQRMKVPINRMMSPETVGGGLAVEYQHVGFSHGQLDFTGDRVDNPLLMSKVNERSFHLDLGLVEKFDLFVDVPRESSTRVGAKIQMIGAPEKARTAGHQLAFTLGMGSSHDSFEAGYTIKLKSTLQDYSLIHGYRLNENVLIYDGISLTNFKFKGDIEDSDTLNDDHFEYEAENILGIHAGLAVGASGVKAKAEFAAQQITWSRSQTKMFYSFGYSLMAYW